MRRILAAIALLFGVDYPDPPYNPNMDLTGTILGRVDGKIYIRDLALVAKHFGEVCT